MSVSQLIGLKAGTRSIVGQVQLIVKGNTMSPTGPAFESSASEAAGFPISLSIFADEMLVRENMRDDAITAGFRIAELAEVSVLLDIATDPLGEVVLIDCPEVDEPILDALARLDERVNTRGAHRFPIRIWCGASFVSASCEGVISMPICSAIPPGTCC